VIPDAVARWVFAPARKSFATSIVAAIPAVWQRSSEEFTLSAR
jgi:hypothetical protein